MKEIIEASNGRRFYSVQRNKDGTLDVYLHPDKLSKIPEELMKYDEIFLVVKGVEPFDGIEEDIRCRFSSWCESAEVIVI